MNTNFRKAPRQPVSVVEKKQFCPKCWIPGTNPDPVWLVREDVAALSPYMTSHIKRFGDYLIDLDTVPQIGNSGAGNALGDRSGFGNCSL